MIYVIMCGGKYPHFERHKALTVINGEPLAKRTVRLLKAKTNGQIFITASDPAFEGIAPILGHENHYQHNGQEAKGYWLDAFYPYFLDGTQVTFLFGDVYYTEPALDTIINYPATKNTLFGTSDAKNSRHENIGEAFAYKVVEFGKFVEGINKVKEMYDNGLVNRNPIVWELYRYLNGFDINVQRINPETYVCIDDETIDIDYPEEMTTKLKGLIK